MTDQRTSPEEMQRLMRDIVPGWMRGIFGGGMFVMAALATVSVLKHGSGQLDFLLMALSMAGIWFFIGQPSDSAKVYLKRPQGILYLLWISVISAWFIRQGNWIPAFCFGGASFLLLFGGQRQRKGEVWWQSYLRNPLAIMSTLLLLSYVVWFAWSTGAWVPVGCVIALFPFLNRDIKERCSLKENLARRSFSGSLVVLLIAGMWMWTHVSFGNVAGLATILCLIISDLYLHISSERESLALPHPQS
jgi:hypothetical protein